MGSLVRIVGIGIVTLGSMLALSGCAQDSLLPAVSTPSASASPTHGASTAIPSSSPKPSGTPVTRQCDELVSLQNMYDYNPNFAGTANFTPADQAKQIADINGAVCGWVNETSGEVITLAVGRPDTFTAKTAANVAAQTLTVVPTFGTHGVEGYFGVQGDLGVAEVFTKDYWIILTSASFGEPGDAAPLMNSVLANLG